VLQRRRCRLLVSLRLCWSAYEPSDSHRCIVLQQESAYPQGLYTLLGIRRPLGLKAYAGSAHGAKHFDSDACSTPVSSAGLDRLSWVCPHFICRDAALAAVFNSSTVVMSTGCTTSDAWTTHCRCCERLFLHQLADSIATARQIPRKQLQMPCKALQRCRKRIQHCKWKLKLSAPQAEHKEP